MPRASRARRKTAMINRQIVLDKLPQGKLTPEHFRMTQGEQPTPGEGEVLLRTRYISLDAANRAWMQGATYRAALAPRARPGRGGGGGGGGGSAAPPLYLAGRGQSRLDAGGDLSRRARRRRRHGRRFGG